MSIGDLTGVGIAMISAAALAVQSLAVSRGTNAHSVTTVIAVVFVVNLPVLLPVTVVQHYPDFELTVVALVAFGIGGLLGSLLARYFLFIGIERLGASRAEPLKSTFPLFAVVAAVLLLDRRQRINTGTRSGRFGVT